MMKYSYKTTVGFYSQHKGFPDPVSPEDEWPPEPPVPSESYRDDLKVTNWKLVGTNVIYNESCESAMVVWTWQLRRT